MFVITSAQKDVLDEHARTAFFERARGFLRTRLPDVRDWQDDRASLECIKEGCRVANSYGVVSEQGMVMWLLLYIALGATVYQHPALRALLEEGGRGEIVIRDIFNSLKVVSR